MEAITIVGRHVKRGADERHWDESIDEVKVQYPQVYGYTGLHQATFDSRMKRLGRRFLWAFARADS